MSDTRKLILLKLSDGEVHSGTALAAQLNITRAAVWKHIKALQAEGVSVESDAGCGYRISGGMQLFDESTIQSAFTDEVAASIELHVLDKIASTNDWLLSRLSTNLNSGTVCLVERQTAGRGTKGRQWVSPYGSNIYVSLYWRFDCGPTELGGLSLSIAAMVAQVLTETGLSDVKIKWPNDLYTSQGKLGGILIDMTAEASGPSHVVIGVGLNWDMPVENHALINQAVADLRDCSVTNNLDRNQLAALIINAMVQACQQFELQGFSAFREAWKAQDMVVGQQVQLTTGEKVVTGRACGVNEMGALEIQTESGRVLFSSGEVSLRVT